MKKSTLTTQYLNLFHFEDYLHNNSMYILIISLITAWFYAKQIFQSPNTAYIEGLTEISARNPLSHFRYTNYILNYIIKLCIMTVCFETIGSGVN